MKWAIMVVASSGVAAAAVASLEAAAGFVAAAVVLLAVVGLAPAGLRPRLVALFVLVAALAVVLAVAQWVVPALA